MKSAAFDYVRPTSIEQALARYASSDGGARYLAGGQSLIPVLNFRLDTPSVLIDLGGLSALTGVRQEGDGLWIGAMTRHAQVAADPLVRRHLPLLPHALAHVAHAAIRNRGTLGGSLALADPAAEMPACVVALNATIRTEGPGGRSAIAAADFFQGSYATALAEGDILTGVWFPLADPPPVMRFGEIARRHGDYALAGVAVVEGASSNVVWFGLGDRPLPDAAAAAALHQGPDAAVAAALDGLEIADDTQASTAIRRLQARALLARVLNGAPCR